MRRLALALAVAALAACGTRPAAPRADAAPHADADGGAAPDAAAQALAAEVMRGIGQTPAAAAEAIVRVKAPDQDAETFQLHLWCARDGRVRVEATKMDVEFCSALLRADGTYEAWLPRAKLASRGKLDDEPGDGAERGGLLAALRLAAVEIREGPLPSAAAYRSGPGAQTLLFAQGTLSAQAVVDRDARAVSSKRLFSADGAELAAVTYQRWREFDELRRATIATLAFPGDPTAVSVNIRRLDGLPSISDERMRFALPADAPLVPLRDFLAHLGD